MNINIQIICILISFLYGIFIKVSFIFNNLFKGIIKDILYVYILSLLYIVLIYKINYGMFHIYFFLSMTIGYLIMSKYVKFISNYVKSIKNKFIK